MKTQRLTIPVLSLFGGFVGAALFQFVAVGVNVEAEESRHGVFDSISVKQLVLFNTKNEKVAKLETDEDGLPSFHMGKSERGHIKLKFVSESQPAITVTGGMGRSYSSLSVKEFGSKWEPVLALGHKDERVGVHLSIFNDTGNMLLSNRNGGTLKLDASQGNAWRRMALGPVNRFPIPGTRSRSNKSGASYSNIMAR